MQTISAWRASRAPWSRAPKSPCTSPMMASLLPPAASRIVAEYFLCASSWLLDLSLTKPDGGGGKLTAMRQATADLAGRSERGSRNNFEALRLGVHNMQKQLSPGRTLESALLPTREASCPLIEAMRCSRPQCRVNTNFTRQGLKQEPGSMPSRACQADSSSFHSEAITICAAAFKAHTARQWPTTGRRIASSSRGSSQATQLFCLSLHRVAMQTRIKN